MTNPTSDNESLKVCPFCGYWPRVRSEAAVECETDNCPLSFELIDTEIWNRRPSTEKAPTQWAYDQACKALHRREAEIAALKHDLEQVRAGQRVITGNALDRDVENLRLRNEIAQVRTDSAANWNTVVDERAKLTAEVEQLRAALEKKTVERGELDSDLKKLGYDPEELALKGDVLARVLFENERLKEALKAQRGEHCFCPRGDGKGFHSTACDMATTALKGEK